MRNSLIGMACAAWFLASGCLGSCSEKAVELAAGKAMGGGDVDIDTESGNVTIKGRDGETVELRGEEGRLTVRGKDGEMELHGNRDGKLPDGFPLSIAAGSKVQAGAGMKTARERTFMATVSNPGSLEELAAFYLEQLEEQGLQVERTELDMGGARFITLAGKAEGREASVALSTGEAGITTQISIRENL